MHFLRSKILQFDRNLPNWLKNEKFPRIPCFCSWLWSQNENAESAEFLQKVISGEEKLTRVTFFGKNRFWKRLTLKNLPKYEEKEPSSSIEDPLRGYKKSIFNHYKWYITQMTQLIMNYFQWIVIFQFIRGTNVFSLLKSLNQ